MASVAARVYGPSVHPDEWGFLLDGQVLTGHHQSVVPTRSFYPAGYGVVTGIGAVVSGSLRGAYRFSLFFNVALAVVLALLTVRMARRVFGLGNSASMIAAALVFVMPGTLVSAMFSWPETAARVVFMVFVLWLFHVVGSLRVGHVLAFGLFVGLMPALHGRFTLVLPVVCALYMWWGVRRDLSRVIAGCGVVAVSIGYECSRLLNKFVKVRLYPDSLSQDSRLLKRLVKPSVWPALLRTMTGQTWYLVASTGGLVVVGVVYAVWRIRGETEVVPRRRDPVVVTSAVAIIASILVLFTGGLQLLYGTRADHHVYGRYVEILSPVLVVFAVAGAERIRKMASIAWLCGVFGIPLVAIFYVLVDGGDVVKFGYLHHTFVEPNVPALDAVRYWFVPGLVSMGIFFGIVALVVWGAWKWRGELGLAVLVVALAASTMVSGGRSILARDNDLETTGTSFAIVKQPGTTAVGFDEGVDNDRSYYFLRYKLDPIQVDRFDVSGPDAVIPPEYSCVYGFADKPPTDGQWESVADEVPLLRVLWRRVGATHC